MKLKATLLYPDGVATEELTWAVSILLTHRFHVQRRAAVCVVVLVWDVIKVTVSTRRPPLSSESLHTPSDGCKGVNQPKREGSQTSKLLPPHTKKKKNDIFTLPRERHLNCIHVCRQMCAQVKGCIMKMDGDKLSSITKKGICGCGEVLCERASTSWSDRNSTEYKLITILQVQCFFCWPDLSWWGRGGANCC